MRLTNRLPALFLILTALISCEIFYPDESDFMGTWVSEDKVDTLIFLNDCIFERNFFSVPDEEYFFDRFAYSCHKDSITIVYSGMLEFLDHPTTYHFELRKDHLTIEVTKDRFGFMKKNYDLYFLNLKDF